MCDYNKRNEAEAILGEKGYTDLKFLGQGTFNTVFECVKIQKGIG